MSDDEKALLQIANLEKRLDRFESNASEATKDNATQIDKLRDKVQSIAATTTLVVGFAALCGVLGSGFLWSVYLAKQRLEALLNKPINYVSDAINSGIESAKQQLSVVSTNQQKDFAENLGRYTLGWVSNPGDGVIYQLAGTTPNPGPQTLGDYDICTLSEVNATVGTPGGQGGCSLKQTSGTWQLEISHFGIVMQTCHVLCAKVKASSQRPK